MSMEMPEALARLKAAGVQGPVITRHVTQVWEGDHWTEPQDEYRIIGTAPKRYIFELGPSVEALVNRVEAMR